jgi:formate dehydrogenase major subunit
MSCKDPSIRRGNFDAVINGFTDEQARAEAKRCLECGCHDFEECKLIHHTNLYEVNPDRFAGAKRMTTAETNMVCIERNQGKCILCGLCVRVCEEDVGKGILGLVGRGFTTVVKPEFRDPATIADCANCHKCVDACPTGALKFLCK